VLIESPFALRLQRAALRPIPQETRRNDAPPLRPVLSIVHVGVATGCLSAIIAAPETIAPLARLRLGRAEDLSTEAGLPRGAKSLETSILRSKRTFRGMIRSIGDASPIRKHIRDSLLRIVPGSMIPEDHVDRGASRS